MAADRKRLAQALAAEAARRKMFESIPEAAGQGLPQAPEVTNYGRDLENLSIGLGRGAVNQLEGLKGLVTSPVESVKGIVSGVGEAIRNPRMIAEALQRTGERAASGPLGLGEVVGENVNVTRMPKGVDKREIFIGKSAKTWDAAAAKRAEEMEAAGATPRDIWQETGTFRGPEGQLRQEINDAEATGIFTHLAPNPQRLSPASLRHPAFAEAYPEFASITQFGLRGPVPRGEFSRVKGDADKPISGMITAEGPNEDAVASIMLHEFQHAIQDREKFASGGSSKDFRQRSMPRDIKEIAFKRDMRAMAIANQLKEAGYPISKGKIPALEHPKVMKFAEEAAKSNPDLNENLQVWKNFDDMLSMYPSPKQQYVRLAGEAEARAVEARRKMSDEERRQTFPYESYDVPIEKLIIKR